MPKAIPKYRKTTKATCNNQAVSLIDPTKTPTSEALERVMRIYIAEGYRKRTIQDYRRYFTECIDSIGKPYMEDITEGDIRKYLTFLLEERGLSPVTVNIRLSSIRATFNRMEAESIIDYNPLTTVKKVKEDEQLPKILNETQVKRLFNAVDKDTYVGFRDYCMMLLALKCGLRGNEIEALEMRDIDFDNEVIMLPGAKNKNRRNRPVPMHRKVTESVRQLIDETREYFGEVSYIFVNQFGEKSQPGAFRKRVYRYATVSGLQKECSSSPHCLRHTFAVRFLNSPYGNIRALQVILGHSHLSTTEVYLDYTNDSIQEQYRKAERYDTLDV
ncbi:tyrosine-type recombinase/integrase [Evansella sp. LMS18]|uniref:tyrosine-type recombinase/integrase n=1 Tax=Evansella sp. LMS18 TaxID=2924033 RepID=UPI0020D10295|nr:tyrosine-type recombinase/integrase [Evansella sp. LMS18]UTR09436.1 tyrosine-type recombinase/integrase [Evansella sp. LMS18]